MVGVSDEDSEDYVEADDSLWGFEALVNKLKKLNKSPTY